jgi:hypothetical protein
MQRWLGWAMTVALLATCTARADESAAPSDLEFFRTRIQPVLEQHCYECHSTSSDDVQGGLLLDSRDAARRGGNTGPAVVPGQVDESLLIRAIRHDDLEMPPDAARLPDAVLADFELWVRRGAADPRDAPANELRRRRWDEARAFWAFQPPRDVSPPQVQDTGWPRTWIDHFVLAGLEAQNLRPAPAAAPRTLARRLYFDLWGLPPTPEELETFLQDQRPDAYERLVDSLLASPRYGERWAQHWLDVVRFAETEGFEYDGHLPGAWRYRDYVITAFNEDKPFDQFVREQLAGDECDADGKNETLQAASIFHRLGPVRRNAGNPEIALSRNEVLTERTDIIGTAFLGLTVGCARCHDHKLEPISQKDYYQLQAFVAATHEHDVLLVPPQEQQAWREQTREIKQRMDKLKEQIADAEGAQREVLRKELEALGEQLPPNPPTIPAVHNDDAQRTAIHVLRRGSPQHPGAAVGPRPPSILVPDDTAALPADVERPRSRLAEWLTQPRHPLTARVIANRLWHYHFGRGIVATPNDFGQHGAPPSHPQLLDAMAHRLVSGGWRLKPLHRAIVLSATYRQSSAVPADSAGEARRVDGDNTLLWRVDRRRLTAEEVRDAMLAVSGRLNLAVGGPSVLVPVDQELVDLLYKPSQWEVTKDPRAHDRRSIYLIAKRNLRVPFLDVFDQPTLQTSCPRREASTHAPQALELLNGTLANELGRAFADRLRRESGDDREALVQRAFLLCTGRPPRDQEKQLALEFLRSEPLEEFALAMFNLNAFIYVD